MSLWTNLVQLCATGWHYFFSSYFKERIFSVYEMGKLKHKFDFKSIRLICICYPWQTHPYLLCTNGKRATWHSQLQQLVQLMPLQPAEPTHLLLEGCESWSSEQPCLWASSGIFHSANKNLNIVNIWFPEICRALFKKSLIISFLFVHFTHLSERLYKRWMWHIIY